MHGAVAVDFGATSGRYAAGWLQDGQIHFEVIEQVPHSAQEKDGKLFWNLDEILGLAKRAAAFAATRFEQPTIGIDTWGVDHGFLDADGKLIQAPVCYRDIANLAAFESLAPNRARLYELTGIQHQPFNTICQLVARRLEDPSFPDRAKTFLIFPDLLAYLLTGELNHELTQASTTQLLGLDNRWSEEAFAIADWPVPTLQPSTPGKLGGTTEEGVRIAHVGSHDTASAVCGFGELGDDQMFLNVGTWSLAGCVIDKPLATPEAEAAQFTNERTVDGRVRLLKNIPGFYVINRIHEELGLTNTVPEWLAEAVSVEERIDLIHPDFYNPTSMVETCAGLVTRRPSSEAEWAGLALASLTFTIAKQPAQLEALIGRKITSLRVGGGGSQSQSFCQSLANESGLPVYAGPAEATVLGNLAMQFLASGQIGSKEEMRQIVSRSAQTKTYQPI
jgi:rhamnulokinase